jgi:hypothetical protein
VQKCHFAVNIEDRHLTEYEISFTYEIPSLREAFLSVCYILYRLRLKDAIWAQERVWAATML